MVRGLANALDKTGQEGLIDSSASGTRVDPAFATVADNAGAYGQSIQHGQVVTDTGSGAWVVFGTTFAENPDVQVTGFDVTPGRPGTSGWFTVDSISAGSVHVISELASQSGTWFAAGSGRI